VVIVDCSLVEHPEESATTGRQDRAGQREVAIQPHILDDLRVT
jgi:hypothetical protein